MRSKVASGLGLCGAVVALAAGAGAQEASPAVPQSASLTLGGDVILTLRAAAGGMTPQERVDAIDARISDLLGIPDIKPSEVVVYTPAGKAPVIYALGRRLITVDAATAKSEGEGLKPLELAEIWAKKLQQVLPRVNYRPSNEAEPVIPAHPPLTVTDDLAKVGGNVGYVSLRNKVVFKITGSQSGGMTAQERALILTKRIQVAANHLSAPSASDISVVPVPAETKAAPVDAKAAPTAAKTADNTTAKVTDSDAAQQILVGTTPIITVDPVQAKAEGYKSAAQLATVWAKNVRTALGLSDTVAPVASNAAAPTAAPPATPATPLAVPGSPVTKGGG